MRFLLDARDKTYHLIAVQMREGKPEPVGELYTGIVVAEENDAAMRRIAAWCSSMAGQPLATENASHARKLVEERRAFVATEMAKERP